MQQKLLAHPTSQQLDSDRTRWACSVTDSRSLAGTPVTTLKQRSHARNLLRCDRFDYTPGLRIWITIGLPLLEEAMTTQEPLEVGVDEKGLERRTLTLSGPLEGRPYRVTDFHGGITEITGGQFYQHVLALGAQSKSKSGTWLLRAMKQGTNC